MTQLTFFGVRTGKDGPFSAFYGDLEDAESHRPLGSRRHRVQPVRFAPLNSETRYAVVEIDTYGWEPADPLDAPPELAISGDYHGLSRHTLDDATLEVDRLNRAAMASGDCSTWSVVVELGTVLDGTEMVSMVQIADDLCVATWTHRSAVRVLRFADFSR